MESAYWKCPVCGFQAHAEPEKKNHNEDESKNPDHRYEDQKLRAKEKGIKPGFWL